MSEPTDGTAFRRRYRRPKYVFARFSSALPRSRRSLRMTKSKPARERRISLVIKNFTRLCLDSSCSRSRVL